MVFLFTAAESAEEATEQAKKLVQSGAIKVGSGSREKKGFKRSKNLEKKLRETDKSVGFLPFDSSHSGEEDEKTESIKPKMKGLYESFTPAGSSDYDGESRRSGPSRRDREPPAKGHTVFVHGHGVTEDIIRKHFSNFGNIVNVSIEREKNNAFVTFEKMESADQAIANVSVKVYLSSEEVEGGVVDAFIYRSANNSQKGPSRKDKDTRDLVKYDTDIF
ncbi:hypothetical protein C0Q70_17553 [Pomacea canaliculata]|uniref:Negative elongation factor E n=1 Tax=Pomacea canaliculata TaxID=400727 RepID=A0A2T7NKR1_POMCA|nr:hypothetical protein C0Q70_17553 [Pomacea canaliculata]